MNALSVALPADHPTVVKIMKEAELRNITARRKQINRQIGYAQRFATESGNDAVANTEIALEAKPGSGWHVAAMRNLLESFEWIDKRNELSRA